MGGSQHDHHVAFSCFFSVACGMSWQRRCYLQNLTTLTTIFSSPEDSVTSDGGTVLFRLLGGQEKRKGA